MGKPSDPRPATDNPLARIAGQGTMILDGGLATELEARGCDLDDELWSARVLLESPELVDTQHGQSRASLERVPSASKRRHPCLAFESAGGAFHQADKLEGNLPPVKVLLHERLARCPVEVRARR